VVAQFMSGVESVKSTGHFMRVAQGYVILRMAPGMGKWWMLSVMSAKRKSGEPMLSDSADGYVMKIRADSETDAFKAGYVSAGIAALIQVLEVAKVQVEDGADDE
jgi:hypothetical protein